MTTDEATILLGFLGSGLLLGIVGRWLDLLVSYVKGN